MPLTNTDFKRLTEFFATKQDLERLEEKMATKEDFRKVMTGLDKVLDELLKVRQEQAVISVHHEDINGTLDNHEKRLKKLEDHHPAFPHQIKR